MTNDFALLLIILILIFLTVFELYYKKLSLKYSSKKDELIKANKLYKCHSCNLLSRLYQRKMYEVRHNKIACPHCELENAKFSNAAEDSWTETHIDCPKADAKLYKGVLKTIEILKKLREEENEQLRFLAYNNLRTNSSWINNLRVKLEEDNEINIEKDDEYDY